MKKIKTQENEAKKSGSDSKATDDFLIVGIGASAGGVQALKTFFENVPADSGAAYVVILHLSPDHDSQLTEILQSAAAIPVERVEEKVRVEANRVYVVSPNESLAMSDGHITVSPIHTVEERRAPVDIFFRTLAESHHACAVAVVLSGTGANGSMGIKRIKENGGAAFVQNPREAEFSEMPRNSIATELIDEILNVAEIPAKIVEYRSNRGKVTIPHESETGDAEERQQTALREIFTNLRVRTGHDFSNYKRPTVLRRIERRINVRSVASLPAYAVYLKENADEAHALLKDLLISVTNFFRDKDDFEYLEREIVPQILEGKKSGDQIRVWVAGCATGEEAYSLAMLFAERLSGVLDSPSVQIFATDIDEQAIAAAREGFYTLNDAADVSPERLRRFFVEEAGGYRIRRELRELILFANHNLLKDPPFSRLDLVTCRNLLIYFNHTAQERVLETFHFSLQPNSFMFLGTSESVDVAGDLFAPASLEHHVHQSRQVAPRLSRSVPDLSTSSLRFNQPFPVLNADGDAKSEPLERLSFGDLHWQILEQYAPPSLIVNEFFDIVHVSENAGRFLQVAGEISANLFKLIRPDLRLELSTAVYQAVQRQTNVVAENVPFQTGERLESVNLAVRPIARKGGETADNYILVIFEPSGNAPADTEAVVAPDEPIARQLEEELLRSQTRFRQSVEQSEIQAEELKASNEELQAMNEELRSATEELETGKEELQSVNEELITVNQELKIKIEELSQSVNDFQNLINSTDIGTIFLDRNRRVKMFTPAAREIFNLIPADDGRALSDITHKLEYADLTRDVETVLGDLHSIEREVRTTDGAVYLMRITPYRTSEDRISGTIITFVNITTRKQQEVALRESEEKYRTLFNLIDEGYCVIEMIFDADGKPLDYLFIETNQAFVKQSGLVDAVGRRMREIHPLHEDSWFEIYGRVARTGEAIRFENFGEQLGRRWFELYAARIGGAESNLVAVLFQDITERKYREANLAFLSDFSQALISLKTEREIVESFGEQISRLTNASVCALFEINEAKNEAEITAEWHLAGSRGLDGLFNIPELVSAEFERRMAAGETVVVRDIRTDSHAKGKEQLARFGIGSFVNVPLVRNDEWTLVLGVYHEQPRDWRDDEIGLLNEAANRIWAKITTIRADKDLRESEMRLRLAMDAGGLGTWEWNLQTDEVIWNERHFILFGMEPRPNPLRSREFFDHVHPDERERVAEELQRAVAEKSVFETDFRAVLDSGETRWMSGYGRVVEETNSGEPVKMSGLMFDVTTRKRTEENLRESEERLSLIMKSVEDYAIMTTDPNGFINGWNPGAGKIFGYAESEIFGKNSEILFTPEDREKGVPTKERRTAVAQGKSEDERFHLRKDGSRFYASGVMQPLKDGKIEGFVKIARDMTDKIAVEEIKRDKLMLQKLVGAQEDERKRIARDLHDELGQILTALRLKLESVRKLCEDNKELCGKVDESQLLAKRVDDGVDFLAWELRPAALDDLGLHAALAKYVKEWSHYSGVTAELLGSATKKLRLAPEVETNLYRIAQEALNNIHKYAKAKAVEVSLNRREANFIVLIIADDGKGFNPKTKFNRSKGIGLIGMKERAALIGGTFEIESAPKKGTTIYVRVPAAPEKKEAGDDE